MNMKGLALIGLGFFYFLKLSGLLGALMTLVS
jgi:hypothetical protein